MKFLPVHGMVNAGDRKIIEQEEILDKIDFNIHKFTPRIRPENPDNVIVFPHFAEFGSELIESMYCLPMLMNSKYRGKYSIVMGWHGRAYLYKHLVDEFWEMKEENQWLRDYSRAFHHTSKNLKNVEKKAEKFGKVLNVNDYGVMAVYGKVETCGQCKSTEIAENNEGYQVCQKCRSAFPPIGFYNYVNEVKKRAVWPPLPRANKLGEMYDKYLKGKPKPVGITARGRRCYGRNLQPEFYKRLIGLLEEKGYSPVWIGEKTSILPCPVDHIPDFSVSEDATDLENTLALTVQLKFTVQFWTASTRLAGITGVPYLLFESPDQIYGQGQEGYRMNLCSRGPKKIVLSHYVNAFNDNDAALNLVKQAVDEMEVGNFKEIIGLVENKSVVSSLRDKNYVRIGK